MKLVRKNRFVIALAMSMISGVFVVLFAISGSATEQSVTYVYVGYRLIDQEQPSGYVAHSASRQASFREPFYPMTLITIRSAERTLGVSNRRNGQVHKYGTLSTQHEFEMLVSDGDGTGASGHFFHFPNMVSIPEPSESIQKLMEGDSFGAQSMRDAWDIAHGIGGPIEDQRRVLLVQLTKDALRESEYAWVADAIESGRWTHEVREFGDFLKMIMFAVVVGIAVGLYSAVSFQRDATKSSPSETV